MMGTISAHLYSPAVAGMLSSQLNQVTELRYGHVLFNDRLKFFRAALVIKNLNNLSGIVDDLYIYPVYKNLKDLEALERQIRRGDYTEFILQCCAVTEIHLRMVPEAEFLLTSAYDTSSWIFDHAPTLGDVATLFHRLQSVWPCPMFQTFLDLHVGYPLRRILSSARPPPEWQEIIMIFQSSPPSSVHEDTHRWILHVYPTFERMAHKFPIPALNLLLSIIADAVMAAPLHVETQLCGRVILKLLECGASLTVSANNHQELYDVIKKGMKMNETPWWLEVKHPVPRPERVRATALHRLLCIDWPRELLQEIHRYACCSLDVSPEHKLRFASKPASLRCIAARELKQSQIDKLPPKARPFASKHIQK